MIDNEKIYTDENLVELRTIIESDTVQVEDILEDVEYSADESVMSEVSENDIIDIEIDEAFPYAMNTDLANHAILKNRGEQDAHPIEAISGLRKELDDIQRLKRVYSSENGLAEYYAWSDGNPSWENRAGYFVKMVYDAATGVEHVSICTNKDDVYGVSVQNSGFVGNQIAADHGDDPAYAMVGIVGALRVRTDGTAQIGDYVVPSSAGVATKSENSCGYKVVSTGSYPSYSYVTIAVTPQNDKISKIYGMLMESDGSIGNLAIRLDGLESAIESTSNKVNINIGDIGELKDLVAENGTEIDRVSKAVNDANGAMQAALENVDKAISDANNVVQIAQAAAKDARDVVNDLAGMSELANSMEEIKNYRHVDFDGNEYVGAAGLIRVANENNLNYGLLAQDLTNQGGELAARIVQLDAKLGASVQDIVSHIDRYSVGELSLSSDLTIEQAESILQYDYIYVPTSTHTETIEGYVYQELNPETEEMQDIVVPAKTIQFERGYAYTWDVENVTWVKGDAVSTAVEYSDGEHVGDLWYCFQDVHGPNGEWYNSETLYRWCVNHDMAGWIAVANIRNNYRSRVVSSVKQTADKISQTVTALDGRTTAIEQDVNQISLIVSDTEYNVSIIKQDIDSIESVVYNINGTGNSIKQVVDEHAAQINLINYGSFHVVYQSFMSGEPDPIDGKKYSAPPLWNRETDEFEFNAALEDADGAYYFHSEDKTKYVKVLPSGGYEVYTIGNEAVSAINSRISEDEAIIETTNQLVTEHSTAITNVTNKADANEASINSLVEYNNGQDATMAVLQQQADANSANIGLVVTDGKADGSLIVSAINGQSSAKLNADSIVFSTGVASEDGNFYMKLSGTEAVIRNGDFEVGNGRFRILLNPNDGIHVQKNINVDDNGNVITVNPKWLSTFYTDSNTGTTTIRGGCFRALGDDPEQDSDFTYSAVKQDGFYIYHASTMSDDTDPLDQIPKMKLSVKNEDGMTIRVEVGAGEGKTGDYADSGKLILSKTVEDGENIGKVYMGYNDGYYGFKLCRNTLELLPGTKFKGSIAWDSVNESESSAYKSAQSANSTASSAFTAAYNAYNGLESLVNGGYTGGTFIDGDTICTAKFYAVSPKTDPSVIGAFSSMTGDGFAIYRDASGEIPKLELLVSDDKVDDVSYGSKIRIAIGAGEFGDAAGSWAEAGRLIMEKRYENSTNFARIYFKGKGFNGNEKFLGFYFDYDGVSLIDEGTKFDFNKGEVDLTGATVHFENATVTGLETIAVFG